MSTQESDYSSESFSDIVLPSIAPPTSVGSLINEFLGDLSTTTNFNSISCFTQVNKDKIVQIYGDENDKLNVRTCGINEAFTPLPSKGDQPSIREGFCCVDISDITFDNSNIKSDSKSSSSSSRSSSRSKSLFAPPQKYTPSIAIFGGKSESNAISSELYTYSFSTNIWKKISLISAEIAPRIGHRAVALSKGDHNFIYVFGGTNGFYLEENLLLICLCGDFASCSVLECEGEDRPCGRCDHSMILVDNIYSSFQLKSNNPSSLPTKSGSNASQSPPAISIPSMSSFQALGSAIQSNTTNLRNGNNNTLNNKIISGPAWALIFGGKVSDERSDIDLNRKFNDKNTDKVLGDFWKLEIRSPFDVPKWTLITREGPPGRHSHASFCKDGQFFIAGGYDEKGTPLKDVWRYTFGFGWEEIAVFNNKSIINIFGSTEYGFVQINNLQNQNESTRENQKSNPIENLYVSPLNMDPALVLLSDEFDKLRKKQRMMWNSISEKMEEIASLESEIENGKMFIKNPESFLASTKSDHSQEEEEENDANFNFANSLSKVKKLEKQVGELRIQLFNDSKTNVAAKKATLENPQPLCPKLVDFTLELHQKVSLKTEKFLQRKRELESEVQLYTNQKKLLEGINTNGIKSSDASSKFSAQYIEKLRELEIFKEKTSKAEKKLEKMRKKQVLDDQYIMSLMDEVTKCEKKIAKTDKEITKWQANVERSRIELKMIDSILKVWQSGAQSKAKTKTKSKGKTSKDSTTGSESDNEKQVQKILKKNNALRAKIKEELKSFVDTKLNSFQSMIDSVNSILNVIGDSKQLADCKPAVLEHMPNLSRDLDVLLAPYVKA